MLPPAQESPASTQHRTPKLTPRRQLSAPQHSESRAHAPITGEHAQAEGVQLHEAQVPVLGPPAVPAWQVLVPSHQPQPLRPAQSPQPVAPAHGSGIGQLERNQLHAAVQDPVLGPVELPSRHVLVVAHQPQLSSPVQPLQSVWVPQLLPTHSEPSHDQSPQLPAVGPVDPPTRQLPLPSPHQPQLPRAVQSPQSAASAHGSPDPVHSLESQLQSAQVPAEGPVELPSWHPAVPPHHPHG